MEKYMEEAGQEGALQLLICPVRKQLMKVEDAAARVNMTVAEFTALLNG